MKGFKYVITFDADDQHDPKIITNFLNSLKNGSKVVCGIRNRKQRFAENIFSLYTNFRWGIKDPLCGMKGYSINIYKDWDILILMNQSERSYYYLPYVKNIILIKYLLSLMREKIIQDLVLHSK